MWLKTFGSPARESRLIGPVYTCDCEVGSEPSLVQWIGTSPSLESSRVNGEA